MIHPTYNNRRIIWESKTKQIRVIVSSFLIVVAAFWTKHRTSTFLFWATIVFFGSSGLFMLIRLLNPKNLFVTHSTNLGKQILADQFKKTQEDLGFFSYNDNGFNLTGHKEVSHYNWSDIETVFGFKEDRFTTDEICMDIFIKDSSSIRLTESTPGWHQFNKRLIDNIPTITENWDGEIAVPAFETNMTLLFDRKGRTKEQAEAECYND